MEKIQIITKPDCSRCKLLKDWLDKNHINYEIWDLTNKDIQKRLLTDKLFVNNYCDDMGCVTVTPILRIDNTGKYYMKKLFGIDGIRKEFIKKLIEF